MQFEVSFRKGNGGFVASSLSGFSEFVGRTTLVRCSFSSQSFRTKFEVCTKVVCESCAINASVVRSYLVSCVSLISLLGPSFVDFKSKIVESVVEVCSESI